MIVSFEYTFENTIFRVVPHLSQNVIYVETTTPQHPGLNLFHCNLENSYQQFLFSYDEKQLLALAAYRFLVFKQYPSKVLPLAKGIRIYDELEQKFVFQEPEAENFQYGEDYFCFSVFNQKQTIRFPKQNANQLFFPEIHGSNSLIYLKNFHWIFEPNNSSLHCMVFYKDKLQDTLNLENVDFYNIMGINDFIILQTSLNKIKYLQWKS